MAALIIPNSTTFGQMTNSVVSRLAGLNTTVLRLNEAVTTASTGFTGTPGTEFESPSGSMGMPYPSGNNFGVQPDTANPGANGAAYSAAVAALAAQWATFWTAAAPLIKSLDNGQAAM